MVQAPLLALHKLTTDPNLKREPIRLRKPYSPVVVVGQGYHLFQCKVEYYREVGLVVVFVSCGFIRISPVLPCLDPWQSLIENQPFSATSGRVKECV